jgi:hypothetical protein
VVYLFVQLQIQPHRDRADQLLAAFASLCIALLFACCLVSRYASLLDLQTQDGLLNDHQQQTFMLDQIMLGFVLFGSVVASVPLAVAILAYELETERQSRARDARNARARRLRYVADDAEVVLDSPVVHAKAAYDFPPTVEIPAFPDTVRFHIFLSHVWGCVTGSRSDPSTSGSSLTDMPVDRGLLPQDGAGPDANHQAAASRDATKCSCVPGCR